MTRTGAVGRRTLLAGVASLAVAGCTPGSGPEVAPPPTTGPPTIAPSRPTAGSPTSTPTPTPTPSPTEPSLPPVTDPVSLAALMRERIVASPPVLGEVTERNDAYTRRRVTYRVGPTTVSGILLVPSGSGPFPGIVLNHGYFPVETYYSGQGLPREQERLAREGFVVLHTDYRGYAGSSDASALERELRLGYARDAIAAVLALRQFEPVDPRRIVMLGRSMGGGVTQSALVVAPGLVRAAVIYASVSSDFVDNLNRWTVPNRSPMLRELYARHGTPDERPEFYAGLSPRTHFDRLATPLLMHHGTNDEQCPIAWSRETQDLMGRAGARPTLREYDGEKHTFSDQWAESMRLTLAFLRRYVG